MRTLAAACAACVIAGCATGPHDDGESVVVRTRPPNDYQGTVADWFDLMMPGPQVQRRLAFGEPEASDCALYGSGGQHLGWMVPVIYDTSPTAAGGAAGKGAGRNAGAGKARASAAAGTKTSASGTSSAPPVATTAADGVARATLEEVKISGKGYFFWFSSDTLAAVTRRPDGCPP